MKCEIVCTGLGICTDNIRNIDELRNRINGEKNNKNYHSLSDYFGIMFNSVKEAIDQAGSQLKQINNNRKGFILCSSLGNIDALYEHSEYFEDVYDGVKKIKEKHELGGIDAIVTNTCISGANGISMAITYLKMGLLDACVVCGVDLNSRFISQSFEACGIRSKKKNIQAFSKFKDGIVLGNGAGAIVLVKKEYCNKGVYYGSIIGHCITSDSLQLMAPDSKAFQMKNAIAKALETADIREEEIDCLFTGANGTRLNDNMYATVIRDRFHKSDVSSIKHMVCHTLGASMIIELIGIFICMKDEVLPDFEVDLEDEFLDLNIVVHKKKKVLQNVLLIGNGFTGGNAAIVVRRYERCG